MLWVVVTGLEEKQGAGFNLFPVPNNGRFTLSVTGLDQDKVSIRVYDRLGRMIYEMNNVRPADLTGRQVDLGPVPEGIYSAVLSGVSGNMVRKIIVTR